MVNSVLKGCHIVVFGNHDDPPQKIRGWVEQRSGQIQNGIDENTTHVIVSEKAWNKRGGLIQDLYDRKEKGQNFQIMKYHWLRESCSKNHRFHENKREYSWEREQKDMEAGKIGKNGEPRSAAGLMSQMFTETTEAFVDPREQKRIEAQRKAEEAAKKDEEKMKQRDFLNQRNAMRRNQVAAVFQRGARKARNELLSENHHVYTDSTGFVYDVPLTKVDTRKNRNERYNITIKIYESNGDLPTYAVNAQFAGSGVTTTNNIIACLGSNFQTAFRSFRNAFKEKTGVDWDDRINAAITRNAEASRARGQGTGSPTAERIGVPVDEAETRRQEVAFENAPFQYDPPKYGPRGEFPGQLPPTTVVPDSGEFVHGEQQESEFVMSGGNGVGPSREDSARLSPAEADRMMAELKRSAQELGDEVYDEPHSFGQEQEQMSSEEELQPSQYQRNTSNQTQNLLDELDTQYDPDDRRAQTQSYLDTQTPLDTDYFDHTQMAEHDQGPLMDLIEQEKRNRKMSDEEDELEDAKPQKKLKPASTNPFHDDEDDDSGEVQYPFEFGDENFGGEESEPRGMGDETQAERETSMPIDFGLQDSQVF